MGRRCASLVAALIVLVGIAGCGGSGTTVGTVNSGGRLPRDFFGMNAQLVEQAAQGGKLEYANHQGAQIAKVGVGFVRSSFTWPVVEPNPPSGGHRAYNFSALDGWVAALARSHLRWLPTLKGGPIPTWAASTSAPSECAANAPPQGTANYAALMEAVARRYGRDGSFWHQHPELPYEPITEYEVWNEPNFGRLWCPQPDPAAYARLYVAARRAVDAVDPRALVLVGGLAAFRTDESGPPAKMSFQTFLSTAVAEVPEFRPDVDAVGVHPYGKDPAAVLASLAAFRAALDSVGLEDAPMVADEVGWHTRGSLGLPPVPEPQRAAYFRTVTPGIALSQCGVIGIAAHTWVTLEQRENYPEDWYGMANPITGKPYPSAIAYAHEVMALERGEATRTASPACGGG
jgi:hypothetical protein